MTKQQLIERKAFYEAKKVELELTSFEAEIEAELEKERARLTAKYEAQRQLDSERVSHYVDLLNELIADAEENDCSVEQCEAQTIEQ